MISNPSWSHELAYQVFITLICLQNNPLLEKWLAEVYFSSHLRPHRWGCLLFLFQWSQCLQEVFYILKQLFCLLFCVPANTDPHHDPGPLNADFPCHKQEGSQRWDQRGKGSRESRPWQVNNLTVGEQSWENSWMGSRRGGWGQTRQGGGERCQERAGRRPFQASHQVLGGSQTEAPGKSLQEQDLPEWVAPAHLCLDLDPQWP